MKTQLLLLLLFIKSLVVSAQIGINTSTPDANTALDIVSDDKGILIPRVELNDLSTASPLGLPVTDGVMIYSESGTVSDGFYYWEGNEWNPIGRTPKNVFYVSTSGGTTGSVHSIPATTDIFITYNGNWNQNFRMPNPTISRDSNRLNEFIIFKNNASSNVVIYLTNTDMTSNLTLSTSRSAIFMFDGWKWILVKRSN
jgi:hypothetical protein